MTLYWAQTNSAVLQGEWWPFLFPGLALVLTVLGLTLHPRGHRRGVESAAQGRGACAPPSAPRPSSSDPAGGMTLTLDVTPDAAEADATPVVALGTRRRLRVPGSHDACGRRCRLSIGAGEIVGLAGESGCGKSTLGNAVMQVLRPPARISGGRVLFHGEDVSARAAGSCAASAGATSRWSSRAR